MDRTPLKGRFSTPAVAAVTFILVAVLFISLWQGWMEKQAAELPTAFWILYALTVIALISQFFAAKYFSQNQTRPDISANLLSAIALTILTITQLMVLSKPQDVKGSTVLLGTLGLLITLLNIDRLLDHFRT